MAGWGPAAAGSLNWSVSPFDPPPTAALHAEVANGVAARVLPLGGEGTVGMLDGVSPLDLIDVRADVRGGKPCFVGTRITVYDVLEYLAGGMSAAEIIEDFPELTEAHVRAALEFAALRERRLATPA